MKITKDYLKELIAEVILDPAQVLAKNTTMNEKELTHKVIPDALAELASNSLNKANAEAHFKNWDFNSGFFIKNISIEGSTIIIALKTPIGILNYKATITKV